MVRPVLDDRHSEILGGPASERRPAGSDRGCLVRVAVADRGQAVLGGEADNPGVPRPAERRRVEGLDRVRPDPRVRVVEQSTEDPALGAERIRDKRVGGDRQATQLVDLGDRGAERAERPDPLLDEQRQEVAAEGRHLFADDDLDTHSALTGDRPRRKGGVDALVVRDGDDIEIRRPLRVLEDLDDPGRPVGRQGVDVEIGSAQAVGHRAPSAGAAVAAAASVGDADVAPSGVRSVAEGSLVPAPATRSGQIGKKIAVHCSGACEISSS